MTPARQHGRVPCGITVEYRSPSSFLLSYATNLSRGGMFLETPEPLAVNTELTLSIDVPSHGTVELSARVAWTRSIDESGGPEGMGLEFSQVAPEVGRVIDRLVAAFEGIQVALLSRDGRSSVAVSRAIRSAIATADIVEISEVSLLEALAADCELVVIDADSEPDGGDSALAAARAKNLPVIVLSAVAERRQRAATIGAIGLPIPPVAGELGKAALNALSRPSLIEVVKS